jgi:hypothetical protein
MRLWSILKLTLLIFPALAWNLYLCSPAAAAQDDAVRASAGRRAAAAIQQRDAETEIRQRLPIMVMERRSETAVANNRHNLRVIDSILGKALEILSLALGVALIVSSAVEQKEKKEEIARISVGAGLILFGLFCPRMIHSICELISVSIFH